jgi:hypothetical protein
LSAWAAILASAGKIVSAEAGAFQDVHAALMVHPMPTPYGAFIESIAYARQLARFSMGRPGEYALDATQMRRLEEGLHQAHVGEASKERSWKPRCMRQSKQAIPTVREQVPNELGICLVTWEPLLRYAEDG